MAKKGIYLSEEVGFKAEVSKPRKTDKTKTNITSAKRVEPTKTKK